MEVSANQIIGLVRRGEVPTGETEQWAKLLLNRLWLIWLGTFAVLGGLVIIWWTDPMTPTLARVKSGPGIASIGLIILGGVLMFMVDRNRYRNAYRDARHYLVHYYKALELMGIDGAEFATSTLKWRRAYADSTLRVLARKVYEAEVVYLEDKTPEADRKHTDARSKFRNAFETFAFLELIDREAGYGPFFLRYPDGR